MIADNAAYWQDYYKMESIEELQSKLVFSNSDYEKDKVAKELARRKKEAEEVA